MKRNFLIVLIIISAISLVYSLLSYFGIIQYFLCKTQNIETYLRKYSKSRKIDKTIKVAFVSNNENINKPFINSILGQSIQVNEIIMVTDKKVKIPEQYNKVLSNITYPNIDNDIYNSVIPILLSTQNSDTIILGLNASYIYDYNFIETIIENVDTHILSDNNTYIALKPSNVKCNENITFDKSCINNVKEYNYLGNYRI